MKVLNREVKLRKLFLCWLLSLMLIGAFVIFLPEVSANPDFVTETSGYIIIENNYFIANITKGWHGHVSHFYIKPQDSINIVESYGNFRFLGGHESHNFFDGYSRGVADWSLSGAKESQTTQIIHQDSDIVVIESITLFKEGGFKIRVVDYTIFYADKPYYLTTSERTYLEQTSFETNFETCFLFDSRWATDFIYLDQEGAINNLTSGGNENHMSYMFDAPRLEKYPFVMMYNRTYGKGFYTILLSANPTTISVGFPHSIGSPRFEREYQIKWGSVNEGREINDKASVVYLSGVSGNSTYVNDLASSLYSNTCVQTEDFKRTTSCNNVTTAGRATLTNSLRTMLDLRIANGYIQVGADPSARPFGDAGSIPRLYGRYENSTDSYELITSSMTCIDYSWDNNLANVTWRNDFQGKLRLEINTQVWNNSDSWLQTWNFTTLASLNVTSLKVFFWITAPKSYFVPPRGWYGNLNASVMKFNTTYPLVNSSDVGIVIQNLTNVVTDIGEDAQYPWGEWYSVNQTEGVIDSGNSYVVELLFQQFKRWNADNMTDFGLSDIHHPSESYSEFGLLREKLAWNYFPFDNTNSQFRVNHQGKGSIIYNVVSNPNDLTFTVVASADNITTTRIYVGSRGEPVTVTGATYSYDASSTVLTLTVTHSSSQEVVLDWTVTILGDIDGDGDVDSYDFYLFSGKYGSEEGDEIYDAKCDFDSDGDVDSMDFYIFSGKYGQSIYD